MGPRYISRFLPQREFFLHMAHGCVLCVATSPLPLQTRLSLGGFLPPILDFPLLPLQLWLEGHSHSMPVYIPLLKNVWFCCSFLRSAIIGPSSSHATRSVSVSALHSQYRFCLISALFDLSQISCILEFLYFSFSPRLAGKVLWGFLFLFLLVAMYIFQEDSRL